MVVDTNVFVYALLREPEFYREAAAILRNVPFIVVPDSFRAELVNAVWQWVRARDLTLDEGVSVLRDSEETVARVIPTTSLWERALALAVDNGHSPYDTLFVALAESEGTKLVTYDAKLRQTFPEIALSPAEYLA